MYSISITGYDISKASFDKMNGLEVFATNTILLVSLNTITSIVPKNKGEIHT